MTRILAQAIVDQLNDAPVPLWSVTVTGGVEPTDHRRTYSLSAKSDTLAAQEGMRLFCDEIENMVELGHHEPKDRNR